MRVSEYHGFAPGTCLGTVAPRIEVDDRSYADIDDAEEALVLLLELLLVKDLDCEHALFVDPPALYISIYPGLYCTALHCSVLCCAALYYTALHGTGAWADVHVETLVPVGVQRLLDDARGARLLAIDRSHGKGIRETCSACVSVVSVWTVEVRTEDIALVEAIGGNNCALLAMYTDADADADARARMSARQHGGGRWGTHW